MNSRTTLLFAALAFAAALQAPVAHAIPIVSADQITVNPGDTVTVSMTVSDDGSSGFNMNEIATWDFRLRWNHTALGALLGTSTMNMDGAASMDMAALATHLDAAGNVLHNGKEGSGTVDGSYYLSWASDFVNPYLDFDNGVGNNGFTFNAMFAVSGTAAAGEYVIDFFSKDGSVRSSMGDSGFISTFEYDDVTSPNQRMRVTVNAPAPAPEPGVLALLVGGLGVLGAARLRRRAS